MKPICAGKESSGTDGGKQAAAIVARAGFAVALLAAASWCPPAFAPPMARSAPRAFEPLEPRPYERGVRRFEDFDRISPGNTFDRPSPEDFLKRLEILHGLRALELLKPPAVPLDAGIEQYIRGQEESRESGDLHNALVTGDIDRLTVVASKTDTNDLIVKLKTSRPRDVAAPAKTPHEWRRLLLQHDIEVLPEPLFARGASSQPLLLAQIGGVGESGLSSIRVHVEPATVPVGKLMQEAISHQDLNQLRILDRLVLGKGSGTSGSDPWAAPVRVLEYSDGTQTLTVRPPEPLASFEIKVGGANNLSLKDRAILREYLRNARDVVRTGEPLSDDVSSQLSLLQRSASVHSPRSANRSLADLAMAADLGNAAFASKPAVIIDGLPDPARGPMGMWQLFSMKLSVWTGDAWRNLRASLDFSSFGANTRILKADRRNMLDQLRDGHDNVLVLIAHNADGTIYSSDGEAVPIHDLEQLTRAQTPDRAIVLITCEAGGVGGETPSLAETFLHNRLARAVFASPNVVDAARLPSLLRDLSSKTIREALAAHDIQQIVSIQGPRRG